MRERAMFLGWMCVIACMAGIILTYLSAKAGSHLLWMINQALVFICGYCAFVNFRLARRSPQ